MSDKMKIYISLNGEEREWKEVNTIEATVDESMIKSGRGKGFSQYQLLGKEELTVTGNATISPEFAQWLEEQKKKHEHKNRLESLARLRAICEIEGHDWSTYTISTGYGSNDIEQAGICERCGFNTHAHLEEE